MTSSRDEEDLIVIGGGAAGLAAAIFTARAAPTLRILCVDGARRLGAKILVSGGSRCNVTNRVVSERDFWGGSRRTIRHVLRAFPAASAAAFFTELGVLLHEEEDGKLFPNSNRSRTVLDALLDEAARCRVRIATAHRVCAVTHQDGCFTIDIEGEAPRRAPIVVVATGGRSLPKSGSDGFGYDLAARLGHTIVPTTPALAPLLFSGFERLAGVSHPAELTLHANGRVAARLAGALLWTHFGASGPVVLNMSRHWHRAMLDARDVRVSISLLPGESFESIEAWLREQERTRPRAQLATALATRIPAAVVGTWLVHAEIALDRTMAHVTRDERRALVHALLETTLPVRDSRGYTYAEATAGGVSLEEIDAATMQSRLVPGLYFAGEILDVDGRLGGFNFQWAWSSAWVAARAIARAHAQRAEAAV